MIRSRKHQKSYVDCKFCDGQGVSKGAVILPPLGTDPLGITLNRGDNIPKRILRKRDASWVVWTPQSKSGRYVWLEKFTSDELAAAISKII